MRSFKVSFKKREQQSFLIKQPRISCIFRKAARGIRVASFDASPWHKGYTDDI
jgi:hypothetical protein